MNGLKKLLCLVLALLIMLPAGAFAAGTDLSRAEITAYSAGNAQTSMLTTEAAQTALPRSYPLLCADYLHAMDLMEGVGTRADGSVDYALERPLTRVEAVVMMIRLLGKEDEVLRCTGQHPFTDVPAWADPYIAYAYQTGLTDGVSADRFGTGNASAAMYLTYVLRAMGYSDARGDFRWDDPFDLAAAAGIEAADPDTASDPAAELLRSDAAVLSRHSLLGTERAGSRLYERLIAEGVFSRDQMEQAEQDLARKLQADRAAGAEKSADSGSDRAAGTAESADSGSDRAAGANDPDRTSGGKDTQDAFDWSMVPEYSGRPSVSIHGGKPFFTEADRTTRAFEDYSPLDSLGRCGAAYVNVCKEIMPTEKRGSIGMVKPSGWQISKYDFIPNQYLYNRCHLAGYQLSGENANEKNLVTGTFYMNTEGMNPYENQVASYVNRTGNHVLYRVTPVFLDKELVCRGVLMEGLSVEDGGKGICFCVFAYNVQPKIRIDYKTGKNELLPESEWQTGTGQSEEAAEQAGTGQSGPADDRTSGSGTSDGASGSGTSGGEGDSGSAGTFSTEEQSYDFVLNTRSGVYHYPGCPSIDKMADKNKSFYSGSAADVEDMHFRLCENCRQRLNIR